MGMFRVLLGGKPRKEFYRLDGKMQKKLKALFGVLEANPWPAKEFDLTKLEDMADCFRIRIGMYRVCYHVSTEQREITV